MTFNEYQKWARKTAIYPNLNNNLWYPTLGLCGEAGEVAEKVKKIYRDQDGVVSDKDRDLLQKEIGDVLWYCAALASELGCDLDDITCRNLEKLNSRKDRGMVHGDGDER